MESTSSPPSDSYQKFDTPTEARVRGAIEFARHKGFLRSKREVFEFYGMGHTQGYEILKSSTTRRRHNTSRPDPRSPKFALSEKDIDRMDEILQTGGFEARALTWTQLAAAPEAPSVHWRKIQRAIVKWGYNKCIACTKTYVPRPLMDKRKPWANQLRNSYNIDDWKKVRFSGEVHFGRGPQWKLHIIRKPGERTCQDCNQEQDEPEEKDKKQKF